MKTKLNFIICTILLTALMSCSAGRHATAQGEDDGYYAPDNNYDNNDYDQNYDDQNYDYQDQGQAPSNVSINLFMNSLSPYGRWITYPSYGKVWICNEPGFTPYYTRGHWVYTDFGWTWASDYNWGWAPFHYGRWAFDASLGWMWVPGYEWGPAWVGWRSSNDYYGWAPLAPGININVGFQFGSYMPADRWYFVPKRYISNPYFPKYVVNRASNTTIIRNTTVINNTNVYHNTKYVVGPNRKEVERVTGTRINPVRVINSNRPENYQVVNKNTIKMYRPQINNNNTRITNNQVNVQKDRIIKNSQPSTNHTSPQHPEIFRNDDRRNNDIKPGNNRPDNVRPDNENRNVPDRSNIHRDNNAPPVNRNDQRTIIDNRIDERGDNRNNLPEVRRNNDGLSQQPSRVNAPPAVNRDDRDRMYQQGSRPSPTNRIMNERNNDVVAPGNPRANVNQPMVHPRPEPQIQRPHPQFQRPQVQRPQPQVQRVQPQYHQPVQQQNGDNGRRKGNR